IIKDETQHSCTQDKSKIIIDITVATMRKRARDEVIPIRKIYSQQVVKARIQNPDLQTGSMIQFLSLDGGERLLVFGADWSNRFLLLCDLWHSDGTFKVRSVLFEQLYIIFGFNNGFMIPCAYSLTTRKNAVVSTKILLHLSELGNKLNIKMNPKR
ncbi:unnamed protein product, partial [Didymodactylos carnosus]